VLTDLKLPGTSGLALLRHIHEQHPEIAVIVLTQYGTIDSAIEATKEGAIDYVTKPFLPEELRARLEHAMHEALRAGLRCRVQPPARKTKRARQA